MQEPLFGICFSIDRIEVNLSTCLNYSGLNLSELLINLGSDASLNTSRFSDKISQSSLSSGSMISDVKFALSLSMLSCPLRIVEPIYACDLQCDQTQLGNLYAVLSKRRGEVTKEDIIDGTSLFILSATLPVSESFGFSPELLRKTSGNATAPQLLFSHWNIVSDDPFWRPQTEEELEEYGDSSFNERNIFRVIIDKVRRRKGLPTEEKIVVSAEKQRNMNKKK
jgi:ribosome assembly protein 1